MNVFFKIVNNISSKTINILFQENYFKINTFRHLLNSFSLDVYWFLKL